MGRVGTSGLQRCLGQPALQVLIESRLSSRQPFPMMEPGWLVGFIPDGRGLRRRGKDTFEEVRTDVSFRSS